LAMDAEIQLFGTGTIGGGSLGYKDWYVLSS
jgi:hypothetical protein